MPTLRRSCPRVARIIPNPRPGSQPEPRQPGRLSESSRIERQGRPTLPAACRSRASRLPSRQFCIPPLPPSDIQHPPAVRTPAPSLRLSPPRRPPSARRSASHARNRVSRLSRRAPSIPSVPFPLLAALPRQPTPRLPRVTRVHESSLCVRAARLLLAGTRVPSRRASPPARACLRLYHSPLTDSIHARA